MSHPSEPEPEPDWTVSIRIAGNTMRPCLWALKAKGYTLSIVYEKLNDDDYLPGYMAVQGTRRFSATSAEELLGLVALWEARGDNWRAKPSPEDVAFIDRLIDEAPVYDQNGELEPRA